METMIPAPAIIEPTVGRIVWLWLEPEQTAPFPAIITYVHGVRMINVAAWDTLSRQIEPERTRSVHLVQPGDEVGPGVPYAAWMPYQKGQAARTEQAEKKTQLIDPTLKRLVEATERALAAAKEQIEEGNESLARGAFNVANLLCTDAQLCVSVHGTSGFRVTVGEADPHNPELRQFVMDQLENAGFEKVEVVTEW